MISLTKASISNNNNTNDNNFDDDNNNNSNNDDDDDDDGDDDDNNNDNSLFSPKLHINFITLRYLERGSHRKHDEKIWHKEYSSNFLVIAQLLTCVMIDDISLQRSCFRYLVINKTVTFKQTGYGKQSQIVVLNIYTKRCRDWIVIVE